MTTVAIHALIETDEVVYGPVRSDGRPADEVRVSEDPLSSRRVVYAGGRYQGELLTIVRNSGRPEDPRYALTVLPR